MSELKKEIQIRIAYYESLIGNPKYATQIEQNAAHVALRELKYLDSIHEFELLPTESQSDKKEDSHN